MRPDFIRITSSREDGHATRCARHLVIDFDQALFAHEPQLDPVFACWRDSRDAVFLRIDPLPDSFIRVYVSDGAISDELQLRRDPLGVVRHVETHVEASIDGHLQELRLVCRVIGRSSFGGCFLLGLRVGSGCFLSGLLSLGNLSLRLKALLVSYDFRFRHDLVFVEQFLDVLEHFELELLLADDCLSIDVSRFRHSHKSRLLGLLEKTLLPSLFLPPVLDFSLVKQFSDVFVRSLPHRLAFVERVKARWEKVLRLCFSVLAPDSILVLFKARLKIMAFSFFVARPFR